jgi:hypothetical protein
MGAEELIGCTKWWRGPEFLWEPVEENYGVVSDISTLLDDDPGVKKVSTFTTQTTEDDDLDERLCYFSDLTHAKRAVALCLRYQSILKLKV